jgi:nicotinate-nucleotide--dimethylbenzimidazole phosphoribosyltransferase
MERLKYIESTDKKFSELSHSKWNSVAKPLGSLGIFEEMVEKIAAIQQTADVDISKRTVVVMCADNGVTAEGVTQTDSEVTALCAEAIGNGTSNINVLADVYGADVIAVDIGIARDVDCVSVKNRKIMYGTGNIAKGSAMSRDEAEKAICTGMDIVRELADLGTGIIITGEMGIGNTTTSAAVSSVLLGLSPEAVTGRGAGLSDEGLLRKVKAVRQAIEINRPDVNDAVDIISKVGGLDIAGMTGLFLGGAVYGIPVVIDGVISAVSAVLAYKLTPACIDYMLPSHVSDEPAGKLLLDMIGLRAPLEAGMRLGEGTGGAMLLPLLDGALSVYNSSHRFDDIGIERYVEQI